MSNQLRAYRPSPIALRPFGTFPAFDSLFQEMDQLRQGLFGESSNLSELYKTEEGWSLKVLVPGFTKDQITIDVSKNHISIDAERPVSEGQLVRGGFPNQLSYREQIPATLDASSSEASLVDGVLTISVKAQTKNPGTRVTIQ